MNRIGFGFDMHPFISGRPLILGGVRIPYEMGLEGDSDADVLVHSLIDALLGAAGKGDIGRVFGVGTPEVMGIDSVRLLERTVKIIDEAGYRIINTDSTIIAEKPKITPHIPAMIDILSSILNIPADRINIKATTAKHLGVLGEAKAIAVQSVTLLETK
jgi:2-C-methyl-D-erythritol 2,4-cyclodiphosphate synthase